MGAVFKRSLLWVVLSALLLALLAVLIWLAGRYEASRWQSDVERDAQEAAAQLRAELNRNVQSLQVLQSRDSAAAWITEAQGLLRTRREVLRLEWRGPNNETVIAADTPYWPAGWLNGGYRNDTDAQMACNAAKRSSGPAYSASYFMPGVGTGGLEVMDVCLPWVRAGQFIGYSVATLGLQPMLAEMVSTNVAAGRNLSFTEADGTRLAIHGNAPRSGSTFAASQVIDLPGHIMMLRVERSRSVPDMLPNVFTAMVVLLGLGLATVLALLVRDSRKRFAAEQALSQALAFRKAMEDSLVTGLRARDMQGRITYVNPAFCAMTGYSAEELLAATDAPPYWPQDMIGAYKERQSSRFATISSAAADSGPARRTQDGFESVFARKTGERFPVRIIEAPLIDASGQQSGWMGAVIDVSEQRASEERLRTSQERLQATARLAVVGEMASLLSHELNQPLAAISSYAHGAINIAATNAHSSLGYASKSLENPGTDPMITVALQRIAEQAERAGRVIKSVNDFVRRRERDRERVHPQELLDAVTPLISLQARKNGIEVQLEVSADVASVHCDRTLVEQVILNLARNGLQAMETHQGDMPRKLLIKARNAKTLQASEAPGLHSWVEFCVTDHGSGLSAQASQRLFTPFFTTKAEGMGLGLSLCRTVVEQHGGALVHRPNVPCGTQFLFTLPTGGL
jgi:two-component system, LuxR family, sensor histidine kinase DctS